METNYITLTKENIADEHICCAFSDKKCKDSYELKKVVFLTTGIAAISGIRPNW